MPRRVTEEARRRSEPVSVTVLLERGSLEDLDVLCRHHYGDASRSDVVRRAVSTLLAREAAQVIRGHEIDRRHAEKAAEEARAIALAREERDQEQQQTTLAGALAISALRNPTGGDG
jgi:Arc/MetJ-type ribon-helix-helix transcriptional regulator